MKNAREIDRNGKYGSFLQVLENAKNEKRNKKTNMQEWKMPGKWPLCHGTLAKMAV